MVRRTLAAALALAAAVSAGAGPRAGDERIVSGWRRAGRSPPGQPHELLFGLRQRADGLAEIEARLLLPEQPRHLSLREVGELTRNETALAALRGWLEEGGAEITAVTLGGEYLRASASVATWEELLSGGRFHAYESEAAEATTEPAARILRCPDCRLPASIQPHVAGLFRAHNLPSPRRLGGENQRQTSGKPAAATFIDPQRLREIFNLNQADVQGNPTIQQGVVGLGQ